VALSTGTTRIGARAAHRTAEISVAPVAVVPELVAVLALAALGTLRTAAAALATMPRTESIGASSTGLTNGEFGNRPRRRLLTVGSRKRRTDQRPMDGAIVPRVLVLSFVRVVEAFCRLLVDVGLLLNQRCWRRTRSGNRFFCWFVKIWENGLFLSGIWINGTSVVSRGDAFWSAGCNLRIQRGGRLVLAPLPRNLGLFVDVLRVACGTAGLFHILANHRDDGVVRNAALARTVIVENVTKPKLALLHQFSRESTGGERSAKGGRILA
jgi:hypothetical protein